ncbi:MAG: hypothetical protein J7M12_01725 [Candidatus Hydrogenedentes bacterium]|nr:hypothetical protein [Candidatus Hydrogenedentota bacterium]
MTTEQHNDSSARTVNFSFRGVSGIMLLAAVVVLFLGLNILFVRDDPHRFAGLLILLFVFFFVAAVLALDDIGRITMAAVERRHDIFRRTVGDSTFYGELRYEVRRHTESRNS